MMDTPGLTQTETNTAEKKANLEDTARLFDGPLGIRSISLTGIFILTCFYALYFGRDFFLPVTLAIVLNFLLAPVVRGLNRFRIPRALGSAVVTAVLFTGAGSLAYELSGPLGEWIEKAPETGAKLKERVQPLWRYFDKLANVSDQMEKLTKNKPENRRAPQEVEVKRTSLLSVVFSGTSKLVLSALVVMVLLYFLLASGDLFLTKLVRVLPRLSDKKKAVQIAREIENQISKYLFTMALINVGIGVSSGVLFWVFGLPNPALWGAIAGLLNFIPTVGAVAVAILLTLISVATFPSVTHALMVPIAFLSLTVSVGTFVTPLIMGRRLTLNPVVIFLALSFWGWMWGIPGALLAVPMLAMFKIFCDHIEPLAPLGEFLGR
jgi:predicted PurR-regulated permease PerM